MSFKYNSTQNGMSLKLGYHSKWNVTLKGMSNLKWNVIPNGMSHEMEFNQNEMSLKTTGY